MRRTDILVIGAGPAGTAAAIAAAQKNLSVVLLERAPFPRHRPGEALHPGTEAIFRQLGVDDEVAAATEVRHEGQFLSWGEIRSTIRFGKDAAGPWRGFQILREKLDAILLNRARVLGVRIMQPVAAGSPLFSDGRIAGLNSPEPLSAKYVIDCSGATGVLRRALKLTELRASPILRAFYGYGNAEGNDEISMPSLHGDVHGWVWTARIGQARYNWTRLNFVAGTRRSASAPLVEGIQWDGVIRGADVTWRHVPACAGPGYFLAGDSAAVLDPASSHGVLRAMMSGMMAVHAVSRVLEGSADEVESARGYQEWLSEWFRHDAARLRASYASLAPAGGLRPDLGATSVAKRRRSTA